MGSKVFACLERSQLCTFVPSIAGTHENAADRGSAIQWSLLKRSKMRYRLFNADRKAARLISPGSATTNARCSEFAAAASAKHD
jgi:hypothetical protein